MLISILSLSPSSSASAGWIVYSDDSLISCFFEALVALLAAYFSFSLIDWRAASASFCCYFNCFYFSLYYSSSSSSISRWSWSKRCFSRSLRASSAATASYSFFNLFCLRIKSYLALRFFKLAYSILLMGFFLPPAVVPATTAALAIELATTLCISES